MRVQRFLTVGVFGALLATSGWGSTLLWGNNATFGNVTLEEFNSATGNLVEQFLAPNLTARGDNGRGVAVANNGNIYYTTADSGNVYLTKDPGCALGSSYLTCTATDMGVAFVCTPCNGSISTITFDGADLFVTSYTTGGDAAEYTTGGTLIKTIPGFVGTGKDGFEVITRGGQTEVISNCGDACGTYSLYDINGNLLQANFIVTGKEETGVTYDGTNFYTSDIFNNKIDVWDNNGTYVRTITLGGPLPPTSSGRLIEDLSALGNTVQNTSTPEPASIALVGTVIGAGAIVLRRRRGNKKEAA
jgi:hypothetical protein